MKLSINDLFKYSYCLTISINKYKRFINRLSTAIGNNYCFPKPIYGIKSSKENIKKIFGEKSISDFRCVLVTAEHYFLVRMAKEMNLPFITIFEDDASPHKQLLTKIDYYIENIPDDLDCLRFGYSRVIDRFIKEKPIVIDKRYIQRNVYGSHAYIIFSKYYDAFLENSDPLCIIDDIRLNPYSKHKIYLTKEPLFIQYDSLIDNEKIHAAKEVWYYNKYSNEIHLNDFIY